MRAIFLSLINSFLHRVRNGGHDDRAKYERNRQRSQAANSLSFTHILPGLWTAYARLGDFHQPPLRTMLLRVDLLGQAEEYYLQLDTYPIA
jgi:hypothetical protein